MSFYRAGYGNYLKHLVFQNQHLHTQMCHTGQFDIDDIDAHLCTHLNYGFANMDNQTWKLVAYDPWSHMSYDHLMLR